VEEPPELELPAEPETVTMPRAEADALRRKLAEAERDRRRLEGEQRRAAEERQAEEGKWQELAQQRERELNTERERTARVEREQRIARVASRLKFVDPTDVVGRLTAEEAADDGTAEDALKRIAESSPHLIAKEAPARPEIGQVLSPSEGVPEDGAPKPPLGKAPLRTIEDIDRLSQQEMADRMDEIDWVEGRRK